MVTNKAIVQDEHGFGTPGYIIHHSPALDERKFFIRHILLLESFSVLFEKTALSEDKDGTLKNGLYSTGKRFGYRLSLMNRLPKGNLSKTALNAVFSFLETGYAKKIKLLSLDVEKRVIELETEDLVITSKSDMGYGPLGSIGGVFAYLFGDFSIECSAKKMSQGKHLLTIGDKKVLLERGFEVLECDKMPQSINFESYMLHNMPRSSTSDSLSSFNEMLTKGTASYTQGIMKLTIPEERLIPTEISLLFDVEDTFSEKLVFNSSYSTFYNIGVAYKKHGDPNIVITQLLSALGMGIPELSENGNNVNILFKGYPWFSKETENTRFGYVKGAVTGFLSGSTGRKYEAESISHEMKKDMFDVSLKLNIKD